MADSRSWLSIRSTSHFSIANIPFGIITTKIDEEPHAAIAIGDYALDLKAFAAGDGFSACNGIHQHLAVFSVPTLNVFAELGHPIHRTVRRYLQHVFANDTPWPHILKTNDELRSAALFSQADVRMHLPMQIGDYTDFYAGLHHAFNVGTLFRGAANALQPNYLHLPVGYHGRASSIVVSGTPIRRPWGQILDKPGDKNPIFGACRKLDIELELGVFLTHPSKMGKPVPINEAVESIFGFVMLNDWSARDIQAWEYVPLGPFNSKNFGSTISPWVVLVDALEPFKCVGLEADRNFIPYLRETDKQNQLDIKLEIDLTSKGPSDPIYSLCVLSGFNSKRRENNHHLSNVNALSGLVICSDARPSFHNRLSHENGRSPRIWHNQWPRSRNGG